MESYRIVSQKSGTTGVVSSQIGSFQYCNAVCKCGLPSTVTLVLFVYCHHVNYQTGIAWPSVDRIAASTRLSDTSVRKAIKVLRALCILKLVERGGGVGSNGRGRTNRYKVDLNVLNGMNQEFRSANMGERPTEYKGKRGEVKGDAGETKGSTSCAQRVSEVGGNKESNVFENNRKVQPRALAELGGVELDNSRSTALFAERPSGDQAEKSRSILRNAGVSAGMTEVIAADEMPWVCQDAVDASKSRRVIPELRPNFIVEHLRPKAGKGNRRRLVPDERKGLSRLACLARLSIGIPDPFSHERTEVRPYKSSTCRIEI